MYIDEIVYFVVLLVYFVIILSDRLLVFFIFWFFFIKISFMVLISRWCYKVCYCLNRLIKNVDIFFWRKRNEWLMEIIYLFCVFI